MWEYRGDARFSQHGNMIGCWDKANDTQMTSYWMPSQLGIILSRMKYLETDQKDNQQSEGFKRVQEEQKKKKKAVK